LLYALGGMGLSCQVLETHSLSPEAVATGGATSFRADGVRVAASLAVMTISIAFNS
jgi:hypothetical protein